MRRPHKKCEFASNEIIRLVSKNYSWDESVADKERRRVEKEYEEKLDNFTYVMRNVYNVNKRKLNSDTVTDRFPCSRANAGADTCGTKRRKIMASTSTPISFRQLKQKQESPATDTSCSTADGSFLEGDISCKNDSKLLVDKSFKDMVLTPIKPEDKILTAARDAIAANETMDSSDMFRRRTNSLPAGGNLKYGTRVVLRPAISISGNLTNQSLCCGEIRGEERMNISPVGLEEVFQD